jgi:uncharacterized protein DUF3761/glucodextranase-like protein
MQRAKFESVIAGRRISRAIISCVLIVVTCTLCACGSSNTATTRASTGGATSSATTATPQARVVPVALHLNEGSYSVSEPGTTISGSVTKGALVTVNGHDVAVHSGHWSDPLHLHIGSNPIEVAATMTGRAPANAAIRITRHHSAAELEALARARALAAEERQHRETEAREHKERGEQEKRAAKQRQQLAECTNGTYVNAAGNTVCKPVKSSTQPAGASAECEDGTYSFSESRSGTCSHHGGVKRWLHE